MLRPLMLLSLWISAATPIWADCLLGKVNKIEPVFDDNRIYLPAKIDGSPVLFIVDTAASQTAIYRDAAVALGLPISAWGAQQIPDGSLVPVAETTKTKFRTSARSLDIGRLNGRNIQFHIVEKSGPATLDGLPVVGLLGEDFLSHYDVEMDLKAGLFALYRTEGCERANLAYWTKDYNVVDMIRFNPRDPHVVMSGKLNDSAIVIQMASAMPYTAVSFNAAGSRGVGSDSPGTMPLGRVAGVQGEPVEGWFGTFSNFALDEEKIGQAKIAFIKFPVGQVDIERGSRLAVSESTGAEMLLGFDFLRAHHVLISHTQRKVYFSYSGEAPFAAPKS